MARPVPGLGCEPSSFALTTLDLQRCGSHRRSAPQRVTRRHCARPTRRALVGRSKRSRLVLTISGETATQKRWLNRRVHGCYLGALTRTSGASTAIGMAPSRPIGSLASDFGLRPPTNWSSPVRVRPRPEQQPRGATLGPLRRNCECSALNVRASLDGMSRQPIRLFLSQRS